MYKLLLLAFCCHTVSLTEILESWCIGDLSALPQTSSSLEAGSQIKQKAPVHLQHAAQQGQEKVGTSLNFTLPLN